MPRLLLGPKISNLKVKTWQDLLFEECVCVNKKCCHLPTKICLC